MKFDDMQSVQLPTVGYITPPPERADFEKQGGGFDILYPEKPHAWPEDGLLEEDRQLEAQAQSAEAVEHTVPLRSKLVFLIAYFLLNLTLTISNKAVLGKVSPVRLPLFVRS